MNHAHRVSGKAHEEGLAMLLLGAAALVLIVALLFVIAPVMAAPEPASTTSGTIRDSVVVVVP